jgi:hypothetical protein
VVEIHAAACHRVARHKLAAAVSNAAVLGDPSEGSTQGISVLPAIKKRSDGNRQSVRPRGSASSEERPGFQCNSHTVIASTQRMITSLRAKLPCGIRRNWVTWTRLGLFITRQWRIVFQAQMVQKLLTSAKPDSRTEPHVSLPHSRIVITNLRDARSRLRSRTDGRSRLFMRLRFAMPGPRALRRAALVLPYSLDARPRPRL